MPYSGTAVDGNSRFEIVTKINEDGASAADYSGVPDDATFNSGETEKSFTFSAAQNSVQDIRESVTLTFGTLPVEATEGTPDQATLAITEGIAVNFGAATHTAFKGRAGAAATVILNRASTYEMNVPITSAGMNGATQHDWTGVPPMLIFTPGQSSKTFTVMAYDDTVEYDGETVELGFGLLPIGVASASPSTATVTLMNTEVDDEETEDPAVQCGDSQANKIMLLGGWGRLSRPEKATSGKWSLTPQRTTSSMPSGP